MCGDMALRVSTANFCRQGGKVGKKSCPRPPGGPTRSPTCAHTQMVRFTKLDRRKKEIKVLSRKIDKTTNALV